MTGNRHMLRNTPAHQYNKKQSSELEVLPGKLGNAGNYPDDRHKPRKPKQEEQHQNDINIDVAASTRRPDEEQTSAAVTYPSMALGQNRDVVGQTNESQAASGPMHPSAIEHITLTLTQLSRHHSAPLSRDPSVVGQPTTSVARSHAGYPQASID
ncbi:hypothetical protein BKA81DRAFT_397137 [Phyllosticta paracitricarpa]